MIGLWGYRTRLLAASGLLLGAACGSGAQQGDRAPMRHVVEIRGMQFEPSTSHIVAGDTIVFINRDIVPHTATALSGAWDTGTIAASDSAFIVTQTLGDVAYRCALHPTMLGTIRVNAVEGERGSM